MKTKGKTKRSANKRKPLIILISVFVGAVICFGAVFGIIAAVKNKRAVMKYGNIYLTEGVANYLAATNKTYFIRRLGMEITDSPEFWDRDSGDGRTYGEILRADTEAYIKEVVAANYLFDRYSSLTSAEKSAIKKAASDRIDLIYDGDMDKFNEEASKMGFDYSDFVEGTKMLYKYEKARAAIYGQDGEVLSNGGYYSECDKYYEFYSHVKLLFIRTESEFVTDEDGNRIDGPDGKHQTEELSSAEKTKRLEDIAAIDAAIEALKSGGNMQMTPQMFDSYLEKYSYDYELSLGGYYFSPYSSYTDLYLTQQEGLPSYADIANAALEAELYEYVRIEHEDGICYLYKYDREQYAYAIDSYSEFFEDFYSLASYYLYYENLKAISGEVEVREKFGRIDPVSLPYNTYIIASVEY